MISVRGDNSPMHWDAENLLHGVEDLGYFFFAPVSPMLRDDYRLVDICNDSMPKGLLLYLITSLTVTVKVHRQTLTFTITVKCPSD